MYLRANFCRFHRKESYILRFHSVIRIDPQKNGGGKEVQRRNELASRRWLKVNALLGEFYTLTGN